MRVLFYCQNLLGIGHLTRSLAICRELVHDFEVDFVQGGPEVGKGFSHPKYHTHLLSPLLMEESDSSLYDPAKTRDVEEIFVERKNQLKEISNQFFDHCVIELYPFGRRKFRKEVWALLEDLRKKNPKIKVHCSLRDILVESQGTKKKAEEAVEAVQKYFDWVLVHSDPALVLLEETFPMVEKIKDKIIYTGFVTEEGSGPRTAQRKNQILVSIGGGSVGLELIEAILPVAPSFPEYEFLLVPGPFSAQEKVIELKKQSMAPNIKWLNFLQDFEAELAQSTLSISLAGYNTVMNLLNTRTRGLVYPYKANHEQEMRSRKLMEKNYLYILEQLDKNYLESQIRKALHQPYPSHHLRLDGAAQTKNFLKKGRL